MRVLSVDPGKTCGVVIVETSPELKIIYSGNLTQEETIKVVADSKVDYILIEDIENFGMPAGKDLFNTAKFIGKIIRECEIKNIPYKELTRSKVKLAICNSKKAKDGNIRQALIDKYGDKGTKKDPGFFYGVSSHAWNAFALVETWLIRKS